MPRNRTTKEAVLEALAVGALIAVALGVLLIAALR